MKPGTRFRLLALSLFILITGILSSKETGTYKYEVSGFPQASYSEETGIIGGGIGYLRFYDPAKYPAVPKNSIMLTARYSQKKQFYAELEPDIYIQDGIYQFTLTLKYKNWPGIFYGIGNDSRENDAEEFTTEELDIFLSLRRKIWQSWSIAFFADFDNFRITEREADGILSGNSIPGSVGKSFSSGAGLGFTCDSRDQDDFPTSGSYHNFELFRFSSSLESDFDFNLYLIDLRQYLTLRSGHILAFQGAFTYLDDKPPFYKLPKLDDYLRAMTTDLFMDKGLSALRAEYRTMPFTAELLDRLGFVLFIETGQVAGYLDDFALPELKFSYGFGFRFSLFKDDVFNLRLDIGFGEGMTNFQVGAGEAF